MSIADSATCDTANRPPAGLRKHLSSRAYSLPTTCRAASPHLDPVTRQIREKEDKYHIPDPTEDENYEPDPAHFDAADRHTEEQRQAMALLDDAENLLAVLLASIEDKGDSRAMQVEAVLKIARKKVRKAHTRIDRQDTRYRNLFLAYFELKARVEKEVE